MTIEAALLTAIGTLVTVVLSLVGALVILWKDARDQYRKRAADSALYLHSLAALRSKLSSIQPGRDRRTPSDPPLPDPETLAGFYSTHGRARSRTRG